MKRIATTLPLSLALLASVAGCEGRPRSAPSFGPSTNQPRSGATLAVIDLTAGAPEQQQTSLLGVAPQRKQTFDELTREVERIAKDKNAKAVFIKFGGASIGLARSRELSNLLEPLKATKPVYCHADGYTNSTLYAAARSCSQIYVSPAGDVEAVGIAFQLLYFHRLLADNLNLTIDFLQMGKFKGAEEPFTRDGPSDEARASMEGTLSDLRDSWIEGVRKGRPDAAPDAAEDGPYSPFAAKDAKLIDEVGYADEARDDAKKASGAVREEIRFGPGSSQGGAGDVGELVRQLTGDVAASAPVALIRATGEISMSSGRGLLGGSSGITEHDLVRTLARVEQDDDIKALVLRIDSPGGSALASDLIWHALMRVRTKKPIVVSVGEMAASGGYYMASTGSLIFADETSIVGSIGVVGGKVAGDKALEKIGVHAETIPGKVGDPRAATRAAYNSPLVSWDDPTREKVRETMLGIYNLFLSRIVEGRNGKLTLERLKESAEGRIFSGREGQARGLVDELGGLVDALAKARELAKVPADARVVVLGQHSGLLDVLGAGDDDASGEERAMKMADAARGPRALELVTESVPDLAPFAGSMLPLLQGEHMLVAVPYALVVR